MTADDRAAADPLPADYGPRFWSGVVIGWAIIGFGIHSALRTSVESRPTYSLAVLIVLALLHDLIVAPLVIGIGLALRRFLRGGVVVRVAIGAAIVSLVVTAFGWAEIRGYGRTPSLQSLQLGNYATALASVLGTVWVSAAAIVGVRLAWPRSQRLRLARRDLQPVDTGPAAVGSGVEQGEPPSRSPRRRGDAARVDRVHTRRRSPVRPRRRATPSHSGRPRHASEQGPR